MSTIDDVVKLSGISRSTVFRFLNGQNVREDSKLSILKAMEELNYNNEKLNHHQGYNLEVSISQDYAGFQGFSDMVEGVMSRSDELGIKVSMARRAEDQLQRDYDDPNYGKGVDGVLIIGKSKSEETHEHQLLLKCGMPHLFIDRMMAEKSASFVTPDFEEVAYEVVTYLLNKGHEKILISGNPDTLHVDEQKFNGYRRAFKDKGLKLDKNFMDPVDNKQVWEEKLKERFKAKKHIPTAFFGVCDDYGFKFINIARGLGYRIPDDISVISIDDIDIAKYSVPALTTVRIPFVEMGRESVDALIKLIKKDLSTIKAIMGYHFVERDSVK